jgi:hypothetical protein
MPEGWTVIVILDSCGGGSGGDSLRRQLDAKKLKVVFASGARKRTADETAPAQCPKVGTGGSPTISLPLTGALVRDVKTDPKSKPADKNKDGTVTPQELIEELKNSVVPPDPPGTPGATKGHGTVEEMGKQTSTSTPRSDSGGTRLAARGAAGGLLDATYFVLDTGGNSVTALDLRTGALVRSFATPATAPTAIAWNGAALWVTDAASRQLLRLSEEGNLLDAFALAGSDPDGVAVLGDRAYVLDGTSGRIEIYDAQTGAPLGVHAAPGVAATDLTTDLASLYLLDYAGGAIWRLDPAGGDATKAFFTEPLAGPAFAAMQPWYGDDDRFAWLTSDSILSERLARVLEPSTPLLALLALLCLTVSRRRLPGKFRLSRGAGAAGIAACST